MGVKICLRNFSANTFVYVYLERRVAKLKTRKITSKLHHDGKEKGGKYNVHNVSNMEVKMFKNKFYYYIPSPSRNKIFVRITSQKKDLLTAMN